MKLVITMLNTTWDIFTKTWYYLFGFIVLLIIWILLEILTPGIHGFLGEKSIAFFLSKLDLKKYMIINSLMVGFGGNTAQIDHLIISNFGIFVIETKNYEGLITGDEFSDYWTKVKHRYKLKFYNPLRQNYRHVQVLKELLKEYRDIIYIPIVVFTKRSILKVDTSTDVVHNIVLVDTIKKYQTAIISDNTRDKIYKYLNTLNITDKKSRKEHIHRVQEIKKDINRKISNNICPKCGGLLVIKKGKYGSFRGCNNFPSCKFTINI